MENNDDRKEIIGVPTMLMLPARNYHFKVVLEECELRIPRKGNYSEIAPQIFDESYGEFDVLNGNILYCPSLTKILFACSKYPDLSPNQAFAPIAVVVEDEEVIIIGQVLEFSDLTF